MNSLSFKTIEQRSRPLRERRTEIAAELKKLEVEEWALCGRLRFTCPYCQKQEGLAAFTFIQEYWYTAPYSCAGGDYWNKSKPEVCSIVCPRCAGEIYIFNTPERDGIVAVIERISPSSFFKRFEERHKK